MRYRKALWIILLIASSLPLPAAQPYFRFERLGDKAAIVHIGYDCGAFVLASRRGLVLVDTGVIPSQGVPLREAIEKEFGRKDFLYVVNTHAHFDHAGGNQVFTDVPIIAHQNAVQELNRWYGTPAAREAFVRDRMDYRSQLEANLKKTAEGTADRERLQAQIADETAICDDIRAGRFIPTPPTMTFNDRMTLALGDLTINLIYFGRYHTSSDIVIHVPELDLLLAGDLFMSAYLPMFQSRINEIARNFLVLDALPAGQRAVKTVVDGHAGRMTGDSFRARVAYLKDIWSGVTAARREGISLAATQERLRYEEKYPALDGLIRVEDGVDFHVDNVRNAWKIQSESTSAALESLISAKGLEAAVAEYRKTIAGNERYDANENAMIALGYGYLRNGLTGEAIAAFELNAEAHPDSWNAWDSLAEGHYAAGNRDKAEERYEKSVKLNPDNENGRRKLSEIRGFKLDAARETKESFRFSPGQKTGLRGPYLGQTSPGTKPALFAPGIISTAASMEFGITFSPDGREMYFTRRVEGGQNTIMVSRLESAGWTAPEAAAFAKGYPASEPSLTPDGKKLYFNSNRPRPGSNQAEYAIWTVDRTADGTWSAPRFHGPGMCVTAARSGNLYMTDISGIVSPERPVVVYPRTGEGYGPPQRIGGGVNTPIIADHAFIAPDESYILFDSSGRPGGQGGEGDLYVSFRNPDGSWGEAFNLGNEVNSPGTDFVPSVSPDGRFLFYSTGRDIYWVSTAVLDNVKPPELKKAGIQAAQTLEERRSRAQQKLQESRERLPVFHNDLVALMDVRPGQTVADIGAGAGEFAVKLARTVGVEGRVFANEVRKELTDKMESMKNREKLPQLAIILGREDDPLLPEPVDRMSMNMVYHHLSRPAEFMTRLLGYLKPGGLLAVSAVDIHIHQTTASGSHDPCVSEPEETKAAIEKAGWVFMKMEHPASYDEMYVLIFAPPAKKKSGKNS